MTLEEMKHSPFVVLLCSSLKITNELERDIVSEYILSAYTQGIKDTQYKLTMLNFSLNVDNDLIEVAQRIQKLREKYENI